MDDFVNDIIDVLSTKKANVLLLVSLAAAVMTTVFSGFWAHKEVKFELLGRMGDVKWDFTKSWASNVTALGAIVATILTNSGRAFSGDSLALSLGQYQGLSLFLTTLIFGAAFLYNAIRPAEIVTDEKGKDSVEYRGFIISFFVATALTLWAVWGQLWVLYLMANDMGSASNTLTNLGSAAFQILALVAAIVTLFYAFISIKDTLKFHANTPQNSVWAADKKFVGDEAKIRGFQPREAPIGSWALL